MKESSKKPEILHTELLTELKKHSGNGTKHTGNVAYLGNSHFSYHISNPIKRKIVKEFLKKYTGDYEISLKDFTTLLNSLYKSRSQDEKALAGFLLEYYALHRKSLKPELLDVWLNDLEGWAEIDSLCQSNFTAEELLKDWKIWKQLLIRFSKDKNVSKRRASLVLLTGPISHSDDPRLLEIAFKNIDLLKKEKDILITKAISWLLRSMVRHHKKKVAEYIKNNLDSLPKIAIRETQRKILTGRK